MSGKQWLILIGVLVVLGLGSILVIQQSSSSSDSDALLSTITLEIDGMYCENCAKKITRKLKKLKGVKQATVDYEAKEAQIGYDPERINTEQMINKMSENGYNAQLKNKEGELKILDFKLDYN